MMVNLYRKPYSLNLEYDLVIVVSLLAYPVAKTTFLFANEKYETLEVLDAIMSVAMAFLSISTIIILKSIAKKEHPGPIKSLLDNIELDQLIMMYNNKNQKLIELSKPEICTDLLTHVCLDDIEIYLTTLLSSRKLLQDRIIQLEESLDRQLPTEWIKVPAFT